MSSPAAKILGNLPALFKPGPKSLGICRIKASEAKKASYFLANFLTSFLSLFNFFKSSTDMCGMPALMASSMRLVTENADGELWLGDVWELDGTGESLVFLWIVVLEHDLELNGFSKFSVLVLAG